MKTKNIFLIFSVFLVAALSGCSVHSVNIAGQFGTRTPESVAAAKSAPEKPDYSQKYSWIIAENESPKYAADVFYIYPTTYVGKGIRYMDTSSQADRKNASDYSMFNMSLFKGQANLFAPYYRQASLETFMQGSYQAALPYLELPCGDILDAFDYYIRNYNNGRPFIIAGFSQGGMMSECIMKKRLGDKKLQKRLIAAYLFGHSISPDTMKKYPWIRQAEKADDIGRFVSINTFFENSDGILTILPGSVSNDPVEWKTGTHEIDMSKYKGAVILTDMAAGKTKDDARPFTSARLNNEAGGVELYGIRPEYVKKALKILGDKSMHSYDFMFFYNNFRENIGTRIDSYINSQH